MPHVVSLIFFLEIGFHMNRGMQLGSTEQDNAGQLRRFARTVKPSQKNAPINRNLNSVILLRDFEKNSSV